MLLTIRIFFLNRFSIAIYNKSCLFIVCIKLLFEKDIKNLEKVGFLIFCFSIFLSKKNSRGEKMATFFLFDKNFNVTSTINNNPTFSISISFSVFSYFSFLF